MLIAVLTRLVKVGGVGDARRDLVYDGLNLPHDLLVDLLIDGTEEQQKTTR
jgi:hypothetical protein